MWGMLADASTMQHREASSFNDWKMPTSPLWMIVAYAQGSRVIGVSGDLPWHHPEDLAFFKRSTRGHAIIMGRKSFESLGRPLPHRLNIVLTRNRDFHAEGVEIFHDFESALERARTAEGKQPPFVIGGGQIYELALKSGQVTHVSATEIRSSVADGDARFPPLDSNWKEASRSASGDCTFLQFTRSGCEKLAAPPRFND